MSSSIPYSTIAALIAKNRASSSTVPLSTTVSDGENQADYLSRMIPESHMNSLGLNNSSSASISALEAYNQFQQKNAALLNQQRAAAAAASHDRLLVTENPQRLFNMSEESIGTGTDMPFGSRRQRDNREFFYDTSTDTAGASIGDLGYSREAALAAAAAGAVRGSNYGVSDPVSLQQRLLSQKFAIPGGTPYGHGVLSGCIPPGLATSYDVERERQLIFQENIDRQIMERDRAELLNLQNETRLREKILLQEHFRLKQQQDQAAAAVLLGRITGDFGPVATHLGRAGLSASSSSQDTQFISPIDQAGRLQREKQDQKEKMNSLGDNSSHKKSLPTSDSFGRREQAPKRPSSSQTSSTSLKKKAPSRKSRDTRVSALGNNPPAQNSLPTSTSAVSVSEKSKITTSTAHGNKCQSKSLAGSPSNSHSQKKAATTSVGKGLKKSLCKRKNESDTLATGGYSSGATPHKKRKTPQIVKPGSLKETVDLTGEKNDDASSQGCGLVRIQQQSGKSKTKGKKVTSKEGQKALRTPCGQKKPRGNAKETASAKQTIRYFDKGVEVNQNGNPIILSTDFGTPPYPQDLLKMQDSIVSNPKALPLQMATESPTAPLHTVGNSRPEKALIAKKSSTSTESSLSFHRASSAEQDETFVTSLSLPLTSTNNELAAFICERVPEMIPSLSSIQEYASESLENGKNNSRVVRLKTVQAVLTELHKFARDASADANDSKSKTLLQPSASVNPNAYLEQMRRMRYASCIHAVELLKKGLSRSPAGTQQKARCKKKREKSNKSSPNPQIMSKTPKCQSKKASNKSKASITQGKLEKIQGKKQPISSVMIEKKLVVAKVQAKMALDEHAIEAKNVSVGTSFKKEHQNRTNLSGRKSTGTKGPAKKKLKEHTTVNQSESVTNEDRKRTNLSEKKSPGAKGPAKKKLKEHTVTNQVSSFDQCVTSGDQNQMNLSEKKIPGWKGPAKKKLKERSIVNHTISVSHSVPSDDQNRMNFRSGKKLAGGKGPAKMKLKERANANHSFDQSVIHGDQPRMKTILSNKMLQEPNATSMATNADVGNESVSGSMPPVEVVSNGVKVAKKKAGKGPKDEDNTLSAARALLNFGCRL